MEKYTHQSSHLQRIRDFPAYQEIQGPLVEKQSPESKPVRRVQRAAFACAKSFSLYHKKVSVNFAKKKALTVQYSQTADREIEEIPKNVCPIAIVVPRTLSGQGNDKQLNSVFSEYDFFNFLRPLVILFIKKRLLPSVRVVPLQCVYVTAAVQ